MKWRDNSHRRRYTAIGAISFQGCADSSALAARNTSASPCIGPTICVDSGKPSASNPHGHTQAGCCVRLNGYENGVQSKKFAIG